MEDHVLTCSLRIAVPRDRVFDFFSRAENLGLITPPEMAFRILSPLPIEMRVGALIDYRIGLHGIPMTWRTRITRWVPGVVFEDEQLRGPYAKWVHRHTFRDDGEGGTIVEDEVRYRLPLGVLGRVVHFLVRRQLDRIFAYRSERVRELIGSTVNVPEAPASSLRRSGS